MPTIATGARTKLYYIEEDGSGLIPSPAPEFKPIRFVSSGMNRITTQIDSNELNPSRQQKVSRQGTYHVEGEIAGELSFGSHEDLLLAALQASAWDAQKTITAATISAAAADNSYNDSGAGFTFAAGEMVEVLGFTGNVVNNISYGVIATADSSKITIASPVGDAIVDETAGDSVTIRTIGESLIVGTTVKQFAIVEVHEDIGEAYVYRHCRVNGFNVSAPINSAAGLTFPLVGEAHEEYTFPGDETYATPTDTEMMVTTQGGFTENGTLVDYLTDYSLQFTNNHSPLFVLFQRPAYSVRNGQFQASGSMTALMPDGTLFAKYLNESFSDHVVQFTEAGQSYWLRLPEVVYTQADKNVGGQDEILPSYTFSAGYEGGAGTTVQVFRSV